MHFYRWRSLADFSFHLEALSTACKFPLKIFKWIYWEFIKRAEKKQGAEYRTIRDHVSWIYMIVCGMSRFLLITSDLTLELRIILSGLCGFLFQHVLRVDIGFLRLCSFNLTLSNPDTETLPFFTTKFIKEYIKLREKLSLSRLVGWWVGCRLFVGIPLDSCKKRCYKNRAKV